jgi:hypothetical protein
MKQQHGDLELSSTEGKGTVVRLNFPKVVGEIRNSMNRVWIPSGLRRTE